MSIRPHYAEAIYGGSKGYEFRRVRSRIRTGDRVLVYECTPISRVTGEFRVGDVVTGTPAELSALEHSASGHAEIERYLSGARVATAIEIVEAMRWKKAREWQEFLGGRKPPQSYAFFEE